MKRVLSKQREILPHLQLDYCGYHTDNRVNDNISKTRHKMAEEQQQQELEATDQIAVDAMERILKQKFDDPELLALQAFIQRNQLQVMKQSDTRFNRVDERFDEAEVRFDEIDGRFDNIDDRFRTIDGRFDKIDDRFRTIDGRFDTIDDRFRTIDGRFDTMDERFSTIDEKFEKQEQSFNSRQDRNLYAILGFMIAWSGVLLAAFKLL